jgi:PKD repeat protein
MRRKNLHILLAVTAGAMFLFALSCNKDNSPLVDFYFEVKSDTAIFHSKAINTTSYLWDFGDGQTATEPDPIHIYEKPGDYTVVLTVEGKGGTDSQTKIVPIAPSSPFDLLTGGPDNPDGKAWKISRTITSGDAIFSPITADLGNVYLPFYNDVLDDIGLGEEYDDEFIFYPDGKYGHKVKNGGGMTGYRYASNNNLDVIKTTPYGIWITKFTPDEHAAFTLAEDTTITLRCTMERVDSVYDVTFTDVTVIQTSEPEFFLLQDYTRTVIVKEIGRDKMRVIVFLSSSDVDKNSAYPTHAFLMTLEAK